MPSQSRELRTGVILALGLAVIYGVFSVPDEAPATVILNRQSVYDRIEIPKIGVSAPVVYVSSSAELQIQAGLQYGVVHYPTTARPGELGNCYLIGHSSDYVSAAGEYKKIFAALPQLQIQDEIILSGFTARLVYRVVESKVVTSQDYSVLSQVTGGRRLLTLQTSYPIGSAEERFIVVAELR